MFLHNNSIIYRTSKVIVIRGYVILVFILTKIIRLQARRKIFVFRADRDAVILSLAFNSNLD